MIESINLQNYKAFEDVTIPIQPLTILIGANSVGKSSIIQMLMLLHQTAEEKLGLYSSALKIYGNYVNIGAFENLFKGKSVSKPLVVRIKMSSPDTFEMLKDCLHEYVDSFRSVASMTSTSDYWIEDDRFKTREDFRVFVEDLLPKLKKQIGEDKRRSELFQRHYGIPESITKDGALDELMKGYDIRADISQVESPDFVVSFELVVKSDKLKVSKFSVETGEGKRILLVESKTEKNMKVSSCYSLSASDQEEIVNGVNFNNTVFDLAEQDSYGRINPTTGSFLLEIAAELLRDLSDNFYEDRLNYVSPLRAHPKRYYMLDKAKMTITLDTLDGDAIAEVLKENKHVKKSVNEWFSKFGFNIDVKEFKEVIHHMNVTQNGLSLDITDVGFGISQVLPIIIQGFLSNEESLTIIEQPEIHLHPKMQAELGDLFIDIVTKKRKKLIIETHSEYILRRIRRRISEGKIDRDMVSICLFHPKTKDASAWVEHLEIGDKGAFHWPEEFYDGELTLDVTEFLKNQV
mgnify:CR=1 FL=1